MSGDRMTRGAASTRASAGRLLLVAVLASLAGAGCDDGSTGPLSDGGGSLDGAEESGIDAEVAGDASADAEVAGDASFDAGDADGPAADGALDGGEADVDAGTFFSGENLAFVATAVEFASDRLCDFDGDGLGDNAIAELGEPASSSALMLWSALAETALRDGYGPGLFFPTLDDGGESVLVALSGDGVALGDGLRAPYESMNGCGEPIFVYRGEAVSRGRIDFSAPDYPVLLSNGVAAGRGQVIGDVFSDEEGAVIETEECIAPTIRSLGAASGPTQVRGRSLLEVVLAGGSSLGVAGAPGLSPDVDLDGDGLERVLLDERGWVRACVDGDDTVITGPDCWADERMADAFSLTRRVRYEETAFVGRIDGWMSHCETAFARPSLFGEQWNRSGDWTLALGNGHTCLSDPEGELRCWGLGTYGQLGYGSWHSIGDDEPACAAGPVDVGEWVLEVEAAGNTTCAILPQRRLKCWGDLGPGTPEIGDDETPAEGPELDLGGPVQQLVAGSFHHCALLSGGRVRCWGSGDYGTAEWGLLGQGNTDPILATEVALAPDVELGGRVVSLGAGIGHTCALLLDGTVRCWGHGNSGRLGYGNEEIVGDDETPASVEPVDLGGPAVAIAAGTLHTCALLEDGEVRCWGSGDRGSLGTGSTENVGDDETPASVDAVAVGGPVRQIAAGLGHTCVLLESGAVRCWGYGVDGRLGYGNVDDIGDDETPASAGDVDVGGTVVEIGVGSSHACALLEGGAVRCWGFGDFGRLGYGNEESIGDDETPASAGDVPWDTGAAICGDGVVECLEECDDGNLFSDDGCDPTCRIEAGYLCDEGDPTVCHEPLCGDGAVESDEECDDGNLSAGDGCSPVCDEELGWACAEPSGVGPSECAEYCSGGYDYPSLTSGVAATGTTAGAFVGTRGSCAGWGPEVIYTLKVPTPSDVTISTSFAGTVADTVLHVRADCGDPATELGCDDDGGVGPRSYLELTDVPVDTYYVFVDTWGSAGGVYVVLATVTPR